MTRRTRTTLLIVLIVLFALIAPSVILYSQGYRFDFETKRLVQTGTFYFKVFPRSTEIYLDGKFKKKTSMLTGSVLIENLLPKKYDIEIKKEGFHPWQKSLEVKERRVTEAKNIILFPKNPDFIVASQMPETEMTATSSDKKKVVEFNNYEIWIYLLKDREEKEEVFLTRFSEKIDKVFWLNDYYLIFNVSDKIKITEIDDRDKLNVIDLAKFGNPEIFWDKINKNLYILSEEKLYLLKNLLP